MSETLTITSEQVAKQAAQTAKQARPVGRIALELNGVEVSLQIQHGDKDLLEKVMRHFIGIQKLIQERALGAN